MRITVACEGLGVSAHAVHCASFMCYTVNRGIIAECQNLPNPSMGAAQTVSMLQALDVDTIITGGIDMDFANMLCHAGIEVVAGVKGTAREVVEAYLNRTLIGGDELCHTTCNSEAEDEADPELRAAFDRIEAQFRTATA